MKVAFDARMIAHSGIGTYVRALLQEFARDEAGDRFVVFVPEALRSLVPPAPHFEVRMTEVPVYSATEHVSWPRAVDAAACDLLHVPHYNAPWWGETPLIVTVHDVVHIRYPQFMRTPLHAYVARRWIAHSARRADHVLTVSQTAAADLRAALHLEPDRVTVTPNGIDPRFEPADRARIDAFRARERLPEEFVLYVGLRRPHKNVARLVTAFASGDAKRPFGLPLVLFGRADERDRAAEAAIRAAGVTVQTRDTPLAPADMPLLYGAARALVLPSEYEGFGLPALEAMACGVPVLVSDGGALPEVVGDAALVVAHDDVAALRRGLERILFDEPLRARLVARGARRARSFRWGLSAAVTRRVYRRVSAGFRC